MSGFPRLDESTDVTDTVQLLLFLQEAKAEFVVTEEVDFMNSLHGTTRGKNISELRDFPGGAVVKNLPANAGNTGLIPGLGRSHMPRSN